MIWHTDAHGSLLAPAGPLESWRTQAWADMYPDIPPSWRPVSDAPAAPEAQLQSDARHNRSPAPLAYTVDYFQWKVLFDSWPNSEDLDSSQPECYQILAYCLFIVFISTLCVGMDERKENSVFFSKPQLYALWLKMCALKREIILTWLKRLEEHLPEQRLHTKSVFPHVCLFACCCWPLW